MPKVFGTKRESPTAGRGSIKSIVNIFGAYLKSLLKTYRFYLTPFHINTMMNWYCLIAESWLSRLVLKPGGLLLKNGLGSGDFKQGLETDQLFDEDGWLKNEVLDEVLYNFSRLPPDSAIVAFYWAWRISQGSHGNLDIKGLIWSAI